jgi:hypothetical protein
MILLALAAALVSACGVGGDGGGEADSDAALLAFFNQLVDSDDNPPSEAMTADLFAGDVELFAGRGYDTQPDAVNDKVAEVTLTVSPETVDLEAFAAGDTSTLLAEGAADLTRGDLFLAISVGDLTVGDPAAVAAPTIRSYPIEPDDRVLANDRVRFRVIHALAGFPDPATLIVPGDTVEDFGLGDATAYYIEPTGATLSVTLDGTSVSCPVSPGGNVEAVIAHMGFDIADDDSREPALYCHPVSNVSTSILGR